MKCALNTPQCVQALVEVKQARLWLQQQVPKRSQLQYHVSRKLNIVRCAPSTLQCTQVLVELKQARLWSQLRVLKPSRGPSHGSQKLNIVKRVPSTPPSILVLVEVKQARLWLQHRVPKPSRPPSLVSQELLLLSQWRITHTPTNQEKVCLLKQLMRLLFPDQKHLLSQCLVQIPKELQVQVQLRKHLPFLDRFQQAKHLLLLDLLLLHLAPHLVLLVRLLLSQVLLGQAPAPLTRQLSLTSPFQLSRERLQEAELQFLLRH